MIEIKNVSKQYKNGPLALDDLSLNLPNKGLVAFNGENGCGKTTLLNLLATIDKPNSGEILYNGIVYSKRNFLYLRNRVVSYIQQENLFAEYLTIRENVGIVNNDDSLIDEEFARFHMEDKLENKAVVLSGGQRQKCSVIRGIMKDSKVLLVDEPTNNMDKKTELLTFQLLKEISKTKLVIVVSHNLQLIEEYCDLWVHMDKGKITEVIHNTSVGNLVFEEDKVLVPEDGQLRLSDWEAIKIKLAERRSLVLEACMAVQNQDANLDYTLEKAEEKEIGRKPIKRVISCATKSVFHSAVKLVMEGVFLALLVVLAAMAIHISNIDVHRFEYDMFLANGYEEVNICPDGNVSGFLQEQKPQIDIKSYKHLVSKYQMTSTMLSDFEEVNWDISYDEVYESILRGYAIIDENTEIRLLCGKNPTDSQILITDYIADNFIREGWFASYEEIIEQGFILSNYHFDVSGILKTDYKEFLLTMDSNIQNSENYMDWYQKVLTVYSRLYINYTALCDSDTSQIHMIPLHYGKVFADVCILPEGEVDEATEEENYRGSYVYVNGVFSKLLEKEKGFKTYGGYYYVAGEKEDDNENPTIYLSQRQYDELCQNSLALSSFNWKVDNLETYRAINCYDVKHQMPISVTIRNAVDVVRVINYFLEVIIAVIIGLTIILALLFWQDLTGKDKFALFTFVVNGYSYGQLLLFGILKAIVKLTVELLLAMGFFLLLSEGLNQILSSVAECEMVLMNGDFLTLIISFGVYLVLMLGIVVVQSLKVYFGTPISLYLSAKK